MLACALHDARVTSSRWLLGTSLVLAAPVAGAQSWPVQRATTLRPSPPTSWSSLPPPAPLARPLRVTTYAPSDAPPGGELRSGGRPRATLDRTESMALYALASSYGLALGAWGAVGITSVRDDAPATLVVLPVLGLGAGIVTAALLDGRREIRRGRVYAANAGFVLGITGALGVDMLTEGPLAGATPFARASAYLGAATVGLGAGIAVAHTTDAMPGSASFALSGGFWGAVAGASFQRALADDRTVPRGGEGLLVGEVVGVAAALATAHALRPTPSQTRWLDLGALLGTLAGTLVFSQVGSSQTGSLAGAIGCVAGGALGFALGAPSEAERMLAARDADAP